MGDGGGDIIIKSNSVDLEFDDTLYKKDPKDPKKHTNPNRKITKIRIVDENKNEKFIGGDGQNPLKWTITISTKKSPV